MAAPSLDDLTMVPSQDDILDQEVIPELQKRKVRVTDWIGGGIYRALAYVVALLRQSARVAIATLTAAGFEDYVFGRIPGPVDSDGNEIDVTPMAPTIAKNRYGVIQIAATHTKRKFTLTNTSATPYGPLQDGDMIIQIDASGNRYVLESDVNGDPLTIGASGDTFAIFRSEFPTDSANGIVYNDPPGSTLRLVTSNFPGVTATNPAPVFSDVAHAGTGLGLVTPSGSPASPDSVAVKIVTSGNAGAGAAWQYNFNNGGWSSTQTGSSAVVGDGITVTLTDNGGNPAFLLGEVYYFTAPGSDITEIGADEETAEELGIRVAGLWPSLAFNKDSNGRWIPTSPTQSGYETLARSANDAVRTVLIANGTVNNELVIVIAGDGGQPLSAADVANVQQFFDAYSMETDLPVVETSVGRAITLAGLTVSCKSALVLSAQATLTEKIETYLGGLDALAPLSINGRVDYDYIIALVRTTPGVTQVSGTLTINGSAADLQLPVTPGAYESATWSQSAATAFTWATTS